VREDQAEEQARTVVGRQQPAGDAHVDRVAEQHVQHRDPEQHPEQDRLCGHVGVVGEHARREVLRGSRAVVGLEVDLDELPHLLGRRHRELGRRARRDEDPQTHGHDEEDRCRTEPPPPGAVADRGEVDPEEARHVRPGGPAAARHRGAAPGDQRGQPADEHRVAPGGLHDRQVGGRALVEVDQLVDLPALEPAGPRAAGQQLLEAGPLAAVCGDVRVEVHACRLGG